MNEQTENITRVRETIAPHIVNFIKEHEGREFHNADLQKYVSEHVNGFVSPESPGRILRDLRANGKIDYKLVSRSQSLYRATAVGEQGKLF